MNQTRALLTAWKAKDIPAIKRAIISGADCTRPLSVNEQSPLQIAAGNSALLPLLQLMLKSGADPNHSKNDFPPLYYAIASQNVKAIRLLAKYGADLNGSAGIKGTPLTLAVCTGSVVTVKCLLALGASPTLQDEKGGTPLRYAIEQHAADIAALLIANVI
jgi:ankyrin repeat protein